ncbi:MAG: GNAT family N-acetyltransferase [Thermoplasmata archaeon]|nr:MAG: GNAT family N-acetyltransferase [Thermoplasmata archaeon]
MSITIRRANIDDAEAIANIINNVVDEKKYTSLRKFSVEEEREYINSLNKREAIFVATKNGKIIGFQDISLFAKWSESMSHVGNILTLILKEYRNQGIGKLLAERTLEFARQNGYEKVSTYIMKDNINAINYYKSLGFNPVGRWLKQVKIDGNYHDDLIMELFL